MFPRRQRHLLLFLILLLSLSAAADAEARDNVWKVPIFFVTDRNLKGDGFGTKRISEVDTVSAMSAGIVEVCLPIPADYKMAPWQEQAVNISRCDSVKPQKIVKFDCHESGQLKNGFDQAFLKSVEKSPSKEAFVFVHGFNNSFEVAAERAALLSFYSGCPVILYSWPSADKFLRYSEDECNNEWSQEHFLQFAEHLLELKYAHELKFSAVAHSMGCRIYVRSAPSMGKKRLFRDVYLVNPDIDAQTFIHYLARYMPKSGFSDRFRGQVLISRRDKALSAAEGLFGGYTRLGQGVDGTLAALMRPDLCVKIWLDPNGGGDLEEQKQVSSQRIAAIEKTLRFIDVTQLDHGFLGHSIPFEFIAWNHNTGKPQDGYELKVDKTFGINRWTRFFARVEGQKISRPIGKYYAVVKCAEGEKTQAEVGNSTDSAEDGGENKTAEESDRDKESAESNTQDMP